MASSSQAPRVLGVIPARGGSKRLPRKNIMPVNGHPLIAHTIMAAAKATALTDWLVSSDDDEIIEIAKRYSAPVPFKRPPELSTDAARNARVMIHAVEYLESVRNCRYDIVVLLQPTCPVRDPEHIDLAVKLLWKSELDTCASVKGPTKKRDPYVKAIRDGVLQPYRPDEGDSMEAYYTYNASIYAVKRGYLFDKELFVSRCQVPLVMDRLHSLDIDDEYDLVTAEALIERFVNQAES